MQREDLIKKRFFLSTAIEAFKMAVRRIDRELNPNMQQPTREHRKHGYIGQDEQENTKE